MRLRAKIFAVSFSVSVAVLGGATVALAAFSSDDEEARLASLSGSVGELSALAGGLEAEDPARSAAMLKALEPIRRDLGRRAVLERDADIASGARLALLLIAEAVAALSVSAVAARMLTSRWSRLRDGILELRGGSRSAPFFSGLHDEFGAVEEELDRLVVALDEKARMGAELRALQGWGEASAFLAHQARTPLASLALSAKTARVALGTAASRSAPSDSAVVAEAALARVEGEAARIAALFSRVRSLSGFKDPELSAVDPEEAFLAAASRLAASASSAARGLTLGRESLSVERRGAFEPPRFDRDYLVEAFFNLLSNSLEACAERGIGFSARLALASEEGEYRIEYDDSVTGLEPAFASRVGQARFTTKPDGAGLGVWLVGRVAALHGGEMSVELSERGGLRFILAFKRERGRNG